MAFAICLQSGGRKLPYLCPLKTHGNLNLIADQTCLLQNFRNISFNSTNSKWFSRSKNMRIDHTCQAMATNSGVTINSTGLIQLPDSDSSCSECFGVGHIILGIDIGGTSIKAALVDTESGLLTSERHVICTPQPATPESVSCVLKEMLEHFQWNGAVGVGIPAVVRNGIVCTAANIDPSWIGAHAEEIFLDKSGVKMTVVNDADAAGYAEMAFGAGSGQEMEKGIVMMLTFGTGIGSAMFVDGILVPNLEFGHIELDGVEAEKAAAGVLVKVNSWSWDQWAEKVQWYLTYLERLIWPNLFIIGGGVSNAHEEWLSKVDLPNKTPIKVATMLNDAGIIGAALAALANAAYEETHKPQQVIEMVHAP